MDSRKKCSCLHKRLMHYIRQTVPGKYPIERAIWIAVNLVAFATFSFMIYDATMAYRNTPTATHMDIDTYSTTQVDFPAVVICNSNLVSKRRAETYVERLLQRKSVQSMNLTKSKILELLKYVGHLFTFSSDEETVGDIALLDRLMKTAYNKGPQGYRTDRLTEDIDTRCDEYAIRCQWKGVTRTCADILEPRYTSEGSCCTFNYARWRDHFTSDSGDHFDPPIARTENFGPGSGLWLLLDVNEDDYFYQLLPFVGFKVMIYTPAEYPDAPSGGTKEILIAKGTETFLDVGASVFDSTESVRLVDKNHRNCLFKSELDDKIGGQYSFSNCIMICRVKDIVAKCQCIPFFYPRPQNYSEVRQCNFSDLKCLNRNRNRWWGINPIFNNDGVPHSDEELPDQSEEHLQCRCYSTCTDIDYTVLKSASYMKDDYIVWETYENAVNRTDGHTALAVYFGDSTALKLQHDVQYYWYELLSNYGGICNIFLGLSIISGIQMICIFFQSLFGSQDERKNVSTEIPTAEKITFSENDIAQQYPPISWQAFNVANFSLHSNNFQSHSKDNLEHNDKQLRSRISVSTIECR